MKQYSQHRQSTKTTHKTQTTLVTKILAYLSATQITTRLIGVLKRLPLILLCAVGLYLFEGFDYFSKEYTDVTNDHYNKKKVRNALRDQVLESAKGTPLYAEYDSVARVTDIAWEEVKSVSKKEKTFLFQNFGRFLGELGKWVAWTVYVFINLFHTLYYERNKDWRVLLHITMLMGCFYYIYWIFQQFQDYSKFEYYLMTFISALFAVIISWLITRYKDPIINNLKRKNMRLALFAFKNVKPEKRAEMLDIIKQDSIKKIK